MLSLSRVINLSIHKAGISYFLSSLNFYKLYVLFTTHPNFWTFIIIYNQALDVESMDMEIDLSNLGTVNTVFAALFR